jgi:hypothetical protein
MTKIRGDERIVQWAEIREIQPGGTGRSGGPNMERERVGYKCREVGRGVLCTVILVISSELDEMPGVM